MNLGPRNWPCYETMVHPSLLIAQRNLYVHFLSKNKNKIVYYTAINHEEQKPNQKPAILGIEPDYKFVQTHTLNANSIQYGTSFCEHLNLLKNCL